MQIFKWFKFSRKIQIFEKIQIFKQIKSSKKIKKKLTSRLVVCKTWFYLFSYPNKRSITGAGQYSWVFNQTAVNFDWKFGQISVNFTSFSVHFGYFQLTGYFILLNLRSIRSKLTVLDLTTAHLWVAMFVSLHGTSMICYQQRLIAR